MNKPRIVVMAGSRRREGLSRHLRHYIRPTGWVERLWRE